MGNSLKKTNKYNVTEKQSEENKSDRGASKPVNQSSISDSKSKKRPPPPPLKEDNLKDDETNSIENKSEPFINATSASSQKISSASSSEEVKQETKKNSSQVEKIIDESKTNNASINDEQGEAEKVKQEILSVAEKEETKLKIKEETKMSEEPESNSPEKETVENASEEILKIDTEEENMKFEKSEVHLKIEQYSKTDMKENVPINEGTDMNIEKNQTDPCPEETDEVTKESEVNEQKGPNDESASKNQVIECTSTIPSDDKKESTEKEETPADDERGSKGDDEETSTQATEQDDKEHGGTIDEQTQNVDANETTNPIDIDAYRKEHLQNIADIKKEVEELKAMVDKWEGSAVDKEYLNLSSSLLKTMYQLDGIDSKKDEDIKKLKKEAILFVKAVNQQLDDKI